MRDVLQTPRHALIHATTFSSMRSPNKVLERVLMEPDLHEGRLCKATKQHGHVRSCVTCNLCLRQYL